ncbi:MAG: hypothetical protein GY928_00285 [Colwellia sp.]|nr:hypothetical protein [Colwellia sp.]
MTLIALSINEDALPEHTAEELAEWVKFCVGHTGGVSEENPMSGYDLEARVLEIG